MVPRKELEGKSVIPATNGQAYRAYLESTLALLDGLTTASYYAAPLPNPADEVLAEIINAFTAWSGGVREDFIAAIPSEKRGIFGIFGHRAATLAVRNGDGDWLRLGLIGNVIANTPVPPHRNVDAALVVFYHCAGKLELEAQILFDDAAQFAIDDLAERLKEFGRRTDVTLKAFGWREIKSPEGIRFKFEW